MPKIQAVWAIDIGQAALKALKLVPNENPELVTAEAFDFIEYPKILSQPDADPEELVREALATFTDRNDVKGCKVAIAVPGQAGTCQVHQAASGRKEANSGYRQIRGQAADSVCPG